MNTHIVPALSALISIFVEYEPEFNAARAPWETTPYITFFDRRLDGVTISFVRDEILVTDEREYDEWVLNAPEGDTNEPEVKEYWFNEYSFKELPEFLASLAK